MKSKIENQKIIVSHENQENHGFVASQMGKENHLNVASIKAELGRLVAQSYYDHQNIRIQEWNRVRDIIYRRMEGLDLREVQEKKPEEKKYLEKFKDKYLTQYIRILRSEGKLSDEEDNYISKILEVLEEAERHENEYKKLMMGYVEGEEIYKMFLSHIKGISAVLSSNLIKEFGYCEKAPHISSLWKFTGMHVVEGEAPKRKKGQKLDFNLKIRTMIWKIGDSFVKQRTPFYRKIYDKEKERQLKLMENAQPHEERKPEFISEPKEMRKPQESSEPQKERKPKPISVPKSKMHADLRARRKMIKIFLAHYWMACREIKNQDYKENHLEIASQPEDRRKPQENSEPGEERKPCHFSEPYASSKLGHKHISDWKEAVIAQSKVDEIRNERRKKCQKKH